MERQSNEPQIPLRTLGGIDQRGNPLSVAPERWNVLEGFYFPQNGTLSRLPGKELYTTLDEPILSIAATNNRKNHILVQTTTKLHLFTLDELLGRATNDDFSLVPTTDPGGGDDGGGDDGGGQSAVVLEEEDMPYALIVLQRSANTAGQTAVVPSVDLTGLVLLSDAQGIISSFNGAAGTFVLNNGTYRYEITYLASGKLPDSGDLPPRMNVTLFNNTTGNDVGSLNLDVLSGNFNVNIPGFTYGRFVLTTAPYTYKFRAYTEEVDAGNLCRFGNPGNLDTETYLICKILREATP